MKKQYSLNRLHPLVDDTGDSDSITMQFNEKDNKRSHILKSITGTADFGEGENHSLMEKGKGMTDE